MDNLLKKCFNLSKSSVNTLLFLYDNETEYFTVKQLCSSLKRDRTTIQKAITSLLENELIIKRQRNLNRGFLYVYRINDKKKLKKELKKIIDDNYKKELAKLK
jgi:predicted transcriptional regulator